MLGVDTHLLTPELGLGSGFFISRDRLRVSLEIVFFMVTVIALGAGSFFCV